MENDYTRDLKIDDDEEKELGLHVKMCGQRYNQLVDAINHLQESIRNARQWNVAIFTLLVAAVIGGLLKTLDIVP